MCMFHTFVAAALNTLTRKAHVFVAGAIMEPNVFVASAKHGLHAKANAFVSCAKRFFRGRKHVCKQSQTRFHVGNDRVLKRRLTHFHAPINALTREAHTFFAVANAHRAHFTLHLSGTVHSTLLYVPWPVWRGPLCTPQPLSCPGQPATRDSCHRRIY